MKFLFFFSRASSRCLLFIFLRSLSPKRTVLRSYGGRVYISYTGAPVTCAPAAAAGRARRAFDGHRPAAAASARLHRPHRRRSRCPPASSAGPPACPASARKLRLIAIYNKQIINPRGGGWWLRCAAPTSFFTLSIITSISCMKSEKSWPSESTAGKLISFLFFSSGYMIHI